LSLKKKAQKFSGKAPDMNRHVALSERLAGPLRNFLISNNRGCVFRYLDERTATDQALRHILPNGGFPNHKRRSRDVDDQKYMLFRRLETFTVF